MSVDIINVTCSHLKMICVNSFDKVNGVSAHPVLSDLEYLRGNQFGKSYLYNPTTKAGVLLDKIPLASLFPQTLNIRPFKSTAFSSATPLDAEKLTTLNAKYSTVIGVVESDVLNQPTIFEKELVADFLTFCRVFGFYELGIGDVSLSKVEDTLLISVVDTNNLFTGFVEVLV